MLSNGYKRTTQVSTAGGTHTTFPTIRFKLSMRRRSHHFLSTKMTGTKLTTTIALFLLFFLLSNFFFTSYSSSPISLTLHHLVPPTTVDPLLQIASTATASLLRAHHLKNPSRKNNQHPTLGRIPLIPHSYGGYSVSLNFGTPIQTMPFVFDTGSDLTWAPCTRSYVCKNCSFPNPSSSHPIFLPKLSSSVKLVGCRNPKCSWIHSSEHLLFRCNGSTSASPESCPAYFVVYGMGSTGGVLLDETLVLPGRNVADFAIGCSVFSAQQPPAGIAGFGRGPASIPSQLHLERFSYCLVSRSYDDLAVKAGSILLGGEPENSHDNVSFTPFVNNLAAKPNSPYSVYYYVEVTRITVAGKKVKVPLAVFLPGPEGDGGVIVDSGSTFTFMESSILDRVIESLVEAVVDKYRRSSEVEQVTGLRLCYVVPEGKAVSLPPMEFHFRGGAKMEVPVENWFAFVSNAGDACLTVVSDGEGKSGGPAIILGAFQQQNYHMMFDVRRQRLGFRRERCVVQ